MQNFSAFHHSFFSLEINSFCPVQGFIYVEGTKFQLLYFVSQSNVVTLWTKRRLCRVIISWNLCHKRFTRACTVTQNSGTIFCPIIVVLCSLWELFNFFHLLSYFIFHMFCLSYLFIVQIAWGRDSLLLSVCRDSNKVSS